MIYLKFIGNGCFFDWIREHKRHVTDLGLDGRIILKLVLKKCGVKITGCGWLKRDSNGALLRTWQ